MVDRICAEPDSKQYGRLSVMLQYYCNTESLFTIKPGAFTPSPKVDSAIVRLTPHNPAKYPLADAQCLARVTREAFAQRRKTIRNALKNLLNESEIEQLGIRPDLRPENLSVADYVSLAKHYRELKIRDL